MVDRKTCPRCGGKLGRKQKSVLHGGAYRVCGKCRYYHKF